MGFSDPCAICKETIESTKGGQLECDHYFCTVCISEWLKVTNKCPLCLAVTTSIRTLQATIPVGEFGTKAFEVLLQCCLKNFEFFNGDDLSSLLEFSRLYCTGDIQKIYREGGIVNFSSMQQEIIELSVRWFLLKKTVLDKLQRPTLRFPHWLKKTKWVENGRDYDKCLEVLKAQVFELETQKRQNDEKAAQIRREHLLEEVLHPQEDMNGFQQVGNRTGIRKRRRESGFEQTCRIRDKEVEVITLN